MWNVKNQKRICYFGIMLIITGQLSFTNHTRLGGVITIIGAATVITMKAIAWRNRVKST